MKLANLGSRPDGATVMIDWALPGQASPGYDLAHYLAMNSARMPEAKEDAVAAYRDCAGTGGCRHRRLVRGPGHPRPLGHMLLLGWEKSLGGRGRSWTGGPTPSTAPSPSSA